MTDNKEVKDISEYDRKFHEVREIKVPAGGARHWVFTLQDDGEFKEEFKEIKVPDPVRYFIAQRERGESGNYHWQGYIELSRPVRLAGMKKMLPGAHFEARRGSREQARDYCKKLETAVPGSVPVELGSFSTEPGKRNDLKALYDDIATGDDFADIQARHIAAYARHFRWADRVRLNLTRRRSRNQKSQPLLILTLWGETGSGKTRQVYETEPDIYVVDAGTSQTLWWDGYDGQEAILFDDFYGGIKHHLLLQLTDRYQMSLQIKGGYTFKAWTRVYFTSNRHPKDWYRDESTWPALERRLTTNGSRIVKVGDPNYVYQLALPRMHFTADVDGLQQLSKYD